MRDIFRRISRTQEYSIDAVMQGLDEAAKDLKENIEEGLKKELDFRLFSLNSSFKSMMDKPFYSLRGIFSGESVSKFSQRDRSRLCTIDADVRAFYEIGVSKYVLACMKKNLHQETIFLDENRNIHEQIAAIALEGGDALLGPFSGYEKDYFRQYLNGDDKPAADKTADKPDAAPV